MKFNVKLKQLRVQMDNAVEMIKRHDCLFDTIFMGEKDFKVIRPFLVDGKYKGCKVSYLKKLRHGK